MYRTIAFVQIGQQAVHDCKPQEKRNKQCKSYFSENEGNQKGDLFFSGS